MDIQKFRGTYEVPLTYITYTLEKFRIYWGTLKEAAAPEHVPTYTGSGMSDSYHCVCGWESKGYWDGAEYALNDWREHVADEMGLILKTCPCGKKYLPIDGGKPCHELKPV